MKKTECVPAVYTIGKKKGQVITDERHRKAIARAALIKRDGPPPFSGALCRHLCKNDSTASNGFTCTLHTVWGTPSENMMDKPEEVRKKVGKIVVESGHLQRISSEGGKKTQNILRTCENCGKMIKGSTYFRWHGDMCKSRAAKLENYNE